MYDSSHLLPGPKFLQRPTAERASTVLIVDRDHAIRALLTLVLRHEFTVLAAANGREAESICKSGPRIDVVLSDIQLPDMDGLQVLQVCRRAIPLVRCCLMSGGGVPESANTHAIDAIFSKPFRLDEVVRIVRRLAEKHAATKALIPSP
jgi:DNA-binding NtrC family response regulator